jgi:hypothetical protein
VNYKTAFKLLHMVMTMAVLVLPATSFASDALRAAAISCIRSEILSRIEYWRERPRVVEERFETLKNACAKRKPEFKLCRESALSKEQKVDILHAAAQLDDETVRTAFLNAFPVKRTADFERLYRYIKKRLDFCNHPILRPNHRFIHQTCESDRWQLVIEDFLAREEKLPGAKYLSRWNEDRLETRIPGLYDFLYERTAFDAYAQHPEAYQELLRTPGLSADTISIVSEQAMKKKINDLSKALSDALGETRLRSFRWNMINALSDEGLKLPNATRVDFKTDRILEPLLKLQEDHPKKFEAAANFAALHANDEITEMVNTRFPEIMYILDMYEPSRWFNTATFHMPGYSPRLNEALASFKARLMREAPALDNEAARDQFVSYAHGAIEFSDLLKQVDATSGGKLTRAGIIESNGSFTRVTAGIIRKLKPGQKLSDALKENFGVPVTELEQKLILLQWARQDMLSLPLTTIDKMPEVPKGVALLGGDGIAGGAIDAWTKMQALLAHRNLILDPKLTPDQRVQKVFLALEEGDDNASAMIRSAPEILRQAWNNLPIEVRNRIRLSAFYTSADDAQAVMDLLKTLPKTERDDFYRRLAWNVGRSSRTVELKQRGKVQNTVIGPEILRAFLGYDKNQKEAAESFLKPIEEKLATADFLGPKWRIKYPDVALLAVQEDGRNFKVFVAGQSIDADFRAKCSEAFRSILRRPDEASLRFVLAQP